MDRININSPSLKKAFPKVYEEFFCKCSIVCSSPRSVTWLGEETVRYGGFTLRQALPIRTYVGLSPKQDNKTINVASSLAYDPLSQKFIYDPLDEYQKSLIEHKLGSFLSEVCGIKQKTGFEIHILSELPLNHSLGGVGSFFSSLVSALLLFFGEITAKNVAEWANTTTDGLIKNNSNKFDFVFRQVWKWETLNYSDGSGANPFFALIPSDGPVVFFNNKKTVMTADIKLKVKRGKVDIGDLKFLESAPYWGARADEIFDRRLGWPWPFDWMILHTGSPRNILDTVASVQEIRDTVEETVEEAGQIFSMLKDNPDAPEFYKICQLENKESLWQSYIGVLHINGFQLLLAIRKILEKGFSEKRINGLFVLMNKAHSLFCELNFFITDTTKISAELQNFLKLKIGVGNIGVKISSMSRRSNVIVAFPSTVVRPWINNILDHLRQEVGEKINLSYLSWEDGYEERGGLVVEQEVRSGYFSDFISNNSRQFVNLNEGGEVRRRIISSNSDVCIEEFDLLLDECSNKIYIKGRELTSKDVPSRKAAIELLIFLMEKIGKPTNNKELPVSPYSSYRNELQGKILTPLDALLKKEIGKSLGMKLKGGLMDYDIEFKPENILIGVIKKI